MTAMVIVIGVVLLVGGWGAMAYSGTGRTASASDRRWILLAFVVALLVTVAATQLLG